MCQAEKKCAKYYFKSKHTDTGLGGLDTKPGSFWPGMIDTSFWMCIYIVQISYSGVFAGLDAIQLLVAAWRELYGSVDCRQMTGATWSITRFGRPKKNNTYSGEARGTTRGRSLDKLSTCRLLAWGVAWGRGKFPGIFRKLCQIPIVAVSESVV